MAIPVACPSCTSRFAAPDAAVGRKAKCPKCSTSILIGEVAPVIVQRTMTAAPPAPPIEEPTVLKRFAPTQSSDAPTGVLARFTSDEQDPIVVASTHERVAQILTAGEEIHYIAVQKRPLVNLAPDCVVLTNKRFIIYKPKLLGQVSFVDFIWRDLRDAKLSEGIMGATLTFRSNIGFHSLDYLPKAQARKLYRYAQEREEAVREEMRNRLLEEKRAAAGGVTVQTAVSAPSQSQQSDSLANLTTLKQMLDAGLIMPSEYEAKKTEILARM